MTLHGFWRILGSDQTSLSFKEQCTTAFTCFTALMLTGFVTQQLVQDQAPLLIASMGASAVILFVMPSSPLAQPWSFAAGHITSAVVGVSALMFIPSLVNAAAIAVGLSVLLMLLLRCLHPPGAATALAPILAQSPSNHIDFSFVLMPVGINVLIMLGLAIMLNRLILHRHYPVTNQPPTPKTTDYPPAKNHVEDFYKQEMLEAIAGFDGFLDVNYADLSRLFSQVNLLTYKRSHEPVTCADIMLHNILTVNYDTDVEAAWSLMHEHHLKALPVLDSAKHVIGMVTHYDFLKNIKLTPYANFQERFLAFIRKTPDITTNKPEAIGHIMTRKVTTLQESAPIADLVQFMANNGHRYVPIVDAQQRFVGMIFQRDLIAALFHNKLLTTENYNPPQNSQI
ncbi:MAG: HPP family protein [Methylococcales bacterium]